MNNGHILIASSIIGSSIALGITMRDTRDMVVVNPPAVITTDRSNVVVGLSPGMQWNVEYSVARDAPDAFVDECNHFGGRPDLETFTCYDVDH